VNMEFAFRPATAEDAVFLYELNRTTLRGYVEKTWGPWDEEWQRDRFLKMFRPEDVRIIVVSGRDAGQLITHRRGTELEIGLIEIVPELQGRGLGTRILRDLLAEAAGEGLRVTLQVLKANPSKRLYERLGFTVTGETATHYQMSTKPWVIGRA